MQTKKVQANFDGDALRELKRLQEALGARSVSEVFRKLIGLGSWALSQVENGYSVGAFKMDGSPVKEIDLFIEAAATAAAARRVAARKEASAMPASATGAASTDAHS